MQASLKLKLPDGVKLSYVTHCAVELFFPPFL